MVEKVTERMFIIKANHKDVFIHKMHIKMANMDKQETPPCLIALCGNGKFLTRNLTNKSPFLRKLFNVCTHALIFQSSSVARRANNEFVVFH